MVWFLDLGLGMEDLPPRQGQIMSDMSEKPYTPKQCAPMVSHYYTSDTGMILVD